MASRDAVLWRLLVFSGLVGLAVTAFPALGRAELVRLKGGGFIKDCQIEREDATYLYLRTPSGRMWVPKAVVAGTQKTPSIFDAYDERRARVKPRDLRGMYQLALWCRKIGGLREEMHELLEKVIELEPDHKQARSLLDYVRVDGDWERREPVELEAKISGDGRQDIERQLSIILGARRDLRVARPVSPTEKSKRGPERAGLDARVQTGAQAGATFYGRQLTGGSVAATVTLTVTAKWLKKPMKLTVSGSVPSAVPDPKGAAIAAAFTANGTLIHEFFDRVTEARRKAPSARS